MGGAGGILVASHIVGDEMRRMVDEPERRAEIDAVAARRLRGDGRHHEPDPGQGRARSCSATAVGGLRLPLVEADDEERAQIRAVLERHGLLAAAGDR